MIIVDSSILVAAFRKDEIHHQTALRTCQSADQILVIDYVLAETLTVLKMRESIYIMQKCHDFLFDSEGIIFDRLSDEEVKMSTDFFYSHQKNLSFVDCALVIYKKCRNLPLATFDKYLQKVLS
ncbi:MAG TPA: PIN domain-containing protein [Candidatus Absconditabacterales bacterium]|mgnify:CR=1 FL=1|nr:PIN domain-containing protein [Candidatus Absconditabacterales bacterium]HMT26882.1 PIN domain-containing protein [Candidatus Absconditabacterales bacterium]